MDKYLKLAPLGLFLAYTCKLLYAGAHYSDAPILLVLATISAFYEFKGNDNKINHLQQEFEELKKLVDSKDKEMQELRNHVGGLKFGQQVKLSTQQRG